MSTPAESADAAEPAARRRSSRRTLLVGVGLVLAVLIGVGIFASTSQPAPPAVAESGQGAAEIQKRVKADKAFALPPTKLEGFAGGPQVDLADFRGKPLVINFWATWCAPCVKEMPEFQKADKAFGDKVALLGVDVQDSPVNAEPFVERLGLDYPMAIDPDKTFYLQVGNVGMPTTLLVDADGIVRYRYTGPLDLARLKALVAEHLAVKL